MVPWIYTEPERIARVQTPRKETVPPWMGRRSVPRPGPGMGTEDGEVGEWRLAARGTASSQVSWIMFCEGIGWIVESGWDTGIDHEGVVGIMSLTWSVSSSKASCSPSGSASRYGVDRSQSFILLIFFIFVRIRQNVSAIQYQHLRPSELKIAPPSSSHRGVRRGRISRGVCQALGLATFLRRPNQPEVEVKPK
jgi:hypothetical protein